MAIGLKIKHSTGEITTGTGNLTLNASGNLILDYATFPSADGTAGYVLSTDGAGNLSWIVDAGGIALTDLSVTTAAVGTAALAYNNGSGVFTYTPPNLSSYLTSETSHADVVVDGDFASQGIMLRGGSAGSYSILADASANWNTAFGWGNHASGGYLTSIAANSINDTHIDWGVGANEVNTDDMPEGGTNLYYTNARTNGRIALHIGANLDLTGVATTTLPEGTNLYYTDARADTRAQLKIDALVDSAPGALDTLNELAASLGDDANFSTTMTNSLAGKEPTIAAGTTAQYRRGDKSWQTLNSSIVPENTNLYYTNVRADARIVNAGSANWNTAFGWGNHASGGYLTSVGALTSHTDVTISGPSTGQHLTWSGSAWTNSTVSAASAAGSDTYVQFNDGGNMGADAGLTYAKATDTLTAGTFTTSGASPTVTAAGAMAITTTASNGDITMTPHGSGEVNISKVDINSGAIDGTAIGANSASTGTFSILTTSSTFTAAGAVTVTGVITGNGGFVGNLTGNASTATALQNVRTISGVNFDGTANITLNTSAITENTNLYYTDARADARVTAGSINNLVEDTTPQLGGTLDANSNVIDMGSNNITDAKVGQWDVAYGWGNHASGGYLTSTGVLSSHTDVHNAAPTNGQVLKWDNGNSRWAPATDAGGIALTDLSVTTGSASGGGTLAYNNGTGVFTFQPATAETFTSLVQDTTPQLGGTLDANGNIIDMGSNNITDAKVFNYDVCVATTPNWNAAYVHSQAAHAPAGAEANEFSFKTIAISGQTDVVADTTTDTLTFVAGGNMTLTTSGDTITLAAAGGGGDAFKTIAVSGQSDVVADAAADTLTLVAGSNVTLTTNAGADSVTIAASGGGGGTVDYEEFKCNYATNGQISSISDLSAGISSVNIDSAAGGDVTVNFTGYTTPPLQMIFYGYGYASNVYNINSLGSTGTTLRQLPGGGSSGSPTAFGAFANLQIRITEALTGASRSFGTVTHAWIRFVMGA